MPKKARRPILRRLLIVLVCLLGLVGLGRLVGPSVRHWQVDRAINDFEQAPSQAGAETLVGLIDKRIPTGRQGERILELLLTPTITKREAYPVGRRPTIHLALPFVVPFRNVSIASRERLWCDAGAPHCTEGTGGDLVRGLPRLQRLHRTLRKPGTHRVEIQQRYTLNLHHHERTWSWRPLSGPFPRCLLPHKTITTMPFRSLDRWDYAYTVDVCTDIVVVEKSQAERVELTSNPDLDKTMQEAFSSDSVPSMRWYSTPSGMLRSTGGLQIEYHDLPAAVGFEPVLRLSDGREISDDNAVAHRLHARAESSGQFSVSPSTLLSDEPGSYTGSILLRSDPNCAYRDPAIKAIWSGMLEFPISFTVTKEPDNP